jgi:hypothetical protein
MSTSEGHKWESGADNEKLPSYYAPRKFMYLKMQLQPSKNIGEWLNSQGDIICFDPSIKYESTSCLIVRKDSLLKFLDENDLKIFWTCLGEKQIYADFYHKIQNTKWLELSGVYALVDSEIIGSICPLVKEVKK